MAREKLIQAFGEMRFGGVYSVGLQCESLMSEGFESVFIKDPPHFSPILKHLFSSLIAKIFKRSQIFVLEIAFDQSCPAFSPLSCFLHRLLCCVHIVGFNVKFWSVKLCISPPVLPFLYVKEPAKRKMLLLNR